MKFDHLVRHNGVDYPAGTEVPVGKVQKVELTDIVPEGALEDNPDGSVNVYDESGNKVGTVSKEEAERLEAEASEVAVDAQPKRGRNSKKA